MRPAGVTEPSQGNELVREFEFRPNTLKKLQAPRVPLELYNGGKRVSIHGKGGIREQLSGMDIDVWWPRPTR